MSEIFNSIEQLICPLDGKPCEANCPDCYKGQPEGGCHLTTSQELGAHAEAAYQAMGADESVEDARYLWRRIAASGEAEISKRDLFRLVRGKFKKAECMETPLRVLVEYGYIRIEDVDRDGAGRKASPKIKVNPLAYGHNGQN